MSAFRERAYLGLMVGASTIAVATPGVALAQTPPPVDQTQQTEEQRPTTANTTAADAPPATPPTMTSFMIETPLALAGDLLTSTTGICRRAALVPRHLGQHHAHAAGISDPGE